MAKTLVLAEKPSVGRELARVLGEEGRDQQIVHALHPAAEAGEVQLLGGGAVLDLLKTAGGLGNQKLQLLIHVMSPLRKTRFTVNIKKDRQPFPLKSSRSAVKTRRTKRLAPDMPGSPADNSDKCQQRAPPSQTPPSRTDC